MSRQGAVTEARQRFQGKSSAPPNGYDGKPRNSAAGPYLEFLTIDK